MWWEIIFLVRFLALMWSVQIPWSNAGPIETWNPPCPCITLANLVNYTCLVQKVRADGPISADCIKVYWKIGAQRSDTLRLEALKTSVNCTEISGDFTAVYIDQRSKLSEQKLSVQACENMNFYTLGSSETEFYDFLLLNYRNYSAAEPPIKYNINFRIIEQRKTISELYNVPTYYKETLNISDSLEFRSELGNVSQAWLNDYTNVLLHARSISVNFLNMKEEPVWSLGTIGVGPLPKHKAVHVMYTCTFSAMNSLYGKETRYVSGVVQIDPVVNESTAHPTLMIDSLRLFKNSSIKFSLLLQNPEQIPVKVNCGFYLKSRGGMSDFQDCSSALCGQNGHRMLLGPFVSSDIKARQSSMEFFIRTGFQIYQSANGSLILIPKTLKPFYHLFEYNYFNGNQINYAEDWESELAGTVPLSDFNTNPLVKLFSQQPDFPSFNSTVLLAGPSKTVRPLKLTEISDLATTCAVCGINSDDSQCSSVDLDFGKGTIQPLKFFYQGSGTMWLHTFQGNLHLNFWGASTESDRRDLISSTPAGIFTITATERRKLHIGCYHWILKKWFIFVRESKVKPEPPEFQLVSFKSENKKISVEDISNFKPLLQPQTNWPTDIRCAQLHNSLAWAETEKKKLKNGKTSTLFLIKYLPLVVDSGKKLSVPQQDPGICSCSESQLSAPLLDFLYPDLENPNNLALLVVCGKVVCSNKWSGTKYVQSSVFYRFSDDFHHDNVQTFAADQNYIFYVGFKTRFVVFINEHGGTKKSSLGLNCTFDSVGKKCTENDPHTITKWKTKRIRRIWTYDTEDFLPRPSAECFLPTINDVIVEMIDETTASVEITTKYSYHCKTFAKPAVRFEIQYGLIRSIDDEAKINSEMFTCKTSIGKSKNLKKLSCQSFKTETSRNVTNKYTIGNLHPQKTYYISATVLVDMDDKYLKLWFSGVSLSSLAKVFEASYKSSIGTILKVVLPAVLVPLCLLIGLTIVLLVYVYKKKLYMYRYLTRLSASEIIRIEKLGEGHFGEVWKAKIGNETTIVIKMLKESATYREEKEFREEALILSKMQCDHIVKPVGICLQSRPIMFALEFLNGGSLDKYLIRKDIRSVIGINDLFSAASDVLKACIYLETEGYVHRDIAARNCLVQMITEQNQRPKCVKLSDFGLAKDIGDNNFYSSGHPDDEMLPAAWTAPEVYSNKQSSPKSDVWGFGVLLWEIFSFAAAPFGLCSLNDTHQCRMQSLTPEKIQLVVSLQEKTLADFDDPCSAAFCNALKKIFKKCWKLDPKERPTFKQLQTFMNGVSNEILSTKLPCFDDNVNNASLESSKNLQEANRHSSSGSTTSLLTPVYRSGKPDPFPTPLSSGKTSPLLTPAYFIPASSSGDAHSADAQKNNVEIGPNETQNQNIYWQAVKVEDVTKKQNIEETVL